MICPEALGFTSAVMLFLPTSKNCRFFSLLNWKPVLLWLFWKSSSCEFRSSSIVTLSLSLWKTKKSNQP
jgi:hypothetical protein